MKVTTLPQTDSIQELAQFWDRHDLTDFDDQLEVVIPSVFEREATVEVHLAAPEAETVEELAKSKGIQSADLIREWVLEKLHAA
ncbi:MAG TPA: CopG family antitoxin [Blastocatellia bacterium]